MLSEEQFINIKNLTKKDKKTLVHRILKNMEEMGELSQAVLANGDVSGCGYKKLTYLNMLEESIDSFLCSISIIYQISDEYGIDQNTILKILEKKLDKWETNISKHL